MDISSSLSSLASSVDVSSQVSVRVARMALDEVERQGAEAVKLIQSASEVGSSDHGSGNGFGGQIDVHA